ncbi:uncharacterized protein TOT_040000192 [Theileria orientalis strain Shintoku]|uniref:Peptidase S59 domain-containing protein n=1 Tax=Theileria orientalis strain Shintoku TaxID=869250 RepID=J4C498_THEOR|nr:uncharacterized protein TOT_040000192 [Theileria orientalis strain Shintoku]BAM41811.1 uncharacterized protein TOT_040000192 [Theileria orientalis strain Shintoku]|eukprot:XP_009692112.1 uncharacterized protein TOT_040000192 [Theileria orientalis strain Shintoku]
MFFGSNTNQSQSNSNNQINQNIGYSGLGNAGSVDPFGSSQQVPFQGFNTPLGGFDSNEDFGSQLISQYGASYVNTSMLYNVPDGVSETPSDGSDILYKSGHRDTPDDHVQTNTFEDTTIVNISYKYDLNTDGYRWDFYKSHKKEISEIQREISQMSASNDPSSNRSSTITGASSRQGETALHNSVFNTTGLGQSSSLFGQTSTSTGFGQTSGSLFGQQTTSTGFGQTSTNLFGQPSSTAGFGQSTANTGFGQSSTNLFGQSTANTAFGQPTATTGFGQTSTSLGQPSSTGFGQPSTTTGFGQTSTNLFGQPSTTTAFGQTGINTGFGQSNVSSTTFGQPTATTGFGQTTSSLFGQPSTNTALGQTNITTPGLGQTSTTTGFGQTTSNLFGQPSANTAFGQTSTSLGQPSSTGFGQPSTTTGFGQTSTNLFGQPSSTAGFGQSTANTGFGQTTATSAFGQTTSNLFGQPTANTGLGQASTLGLSQPSLSTGFGQTNLNTAFGAPTATNTTFGQTSFTNTAFGQSGINTGFGQPGINTAFGQPGFSNTLAQPSNAVLGQQNFSTAFGQPSVLNTALGQQNVNNASAQQSSSNNMNLHRAYPANIPFFMQANAGCDDEFVIPEIKRYTSGRVSFLGSVSEIESMQKPNMQVLANWTSNQAGTSATGYNNVGSQNGSGTHANSVNQQGSLNVQAGLQNSQILEEEGEEGNSRRDNNPAPEKKQSYSKTYEETLKKANAKIKADKNYLEPDSTWNWNDPLANLNKKPKDDLYDSETEEEKAVEKRGVYVNENAPKLTKEGYTTRPSIAALKAMTDEELKEVKDFQISREGYGDIVFPGTTDLRGVDLDEAVDIGYARVSVYAGTKSAPEVGKGLNRRAYVSINNCTHDKQGRKRYVSELAHKYMLRKYSEMIGCSYLGVNFNAGTWIVETPFFVGVEDGVARRGTIEYPDLEKYEGTSN